MDIQPKLPSAQIEELRARWRTPAGQNVLSSLVTRWRANSREWRSLVNQLPAVTVRAPHPELLTDLRGLELKHTKLRGAHLLYVDLSYASLAGCDLEDISLQGSKLSWASFEACNLKHSELLQVMADNSKFERCQMTEAILDVSDFRNASFRHTKMLLAVLDGADLREAQFDGAVLAGAKTLGTQFSSEFDRQRLMKRPKDPENELTID